MGSKTPTNDSEKQSRPCQVCKKDFLTIKALRSHEIAKHKASPKSATKKELANKKKSLPDLEKVITTETKKVIPQNTPVSRVSRRLQLKKNKKVEMKENISKTVTPVKSQIEAKNASIKTEFECPLCDKVFPVFFSASKHIEKKHTLNGNEKNSEKFELRPIRIERCISCSEIITNDPHICDNDDKTTLVYKCLGCQKKFTKLVLFNKHTMTSHGADTDYMAFRGIHDFSTWKVNMEARVKVKYSVFDKTTKEQYHQCNYVSPKNPKNITYLCPSVIITNQQSDKIEIQYQKRHFGHSTPDYQLLDEYKKNIIDKNDLNSTITENVYEKFKNLMQSIIIDASKTNLDNLKKLLSMAITMQSCLDPDEPEISITNKSMTDNQITDELEGKRSGRTKRRSLTPDNVIIKRPKVNERIDALLSPVSKSPPSFNDSYKQFIDLTKLESKPPIRKCAKKEVVKTKMGQFSPMKTSPKNEIEKKKPNVLRPTKNNSSTDIFGKANIKDIKYEVRKQENDCNILVLKI